MKLFLTFELPEAAHSRLAQHFSVTQAPPGYALRPGSPVDALRGHDFVLVSALQDRLDAAVLASLPACIRGVATYSVGHDHIDLAAAKARGVRVYSTPDVLSPAVAEVAMLLLLGAARRVTESIALVRSGQWAGWSPLQLNGIGLSGKVLGILGMGRIGQETAHRARGFGMKIHYANRNRLPPALEKDAVFHDTPEALLRISQFFLLACPATPQTIGFLNRRTIDLLPEAAIVANVGRGALVVDQDLAEALACGRIAGAGLDVFNNEPHYFADYAALPNVFMLPHIGSSTVEARTAMADIVAHGLLSAVTGPDAPNRIA